MFLQESAKCDVLNCKFENVKAEAPFVFVDPSISKSDSQEKL